MNLITIVVFFNLTPTLTLTLTGSSSPSPKGEGKHFLQPWRLNWGEAKNKKPCDSYIPIT
jgi:hypothetical protein